MDQAAAQRVGDLIAGRYRLLRLLGAGGMGAVYEATHEFTQRNVAVKLMHPTFARSKQAAQRFVREAQAPSWIGHPGIVEVLDGGRAEDGTLYLVLELLEGETLHARLKRKPLTPAELGALALTLLDALQAAHAAGFVHRDIKPENVFLSGGEDGGTPRLKLLDFGVASVLSADTPGITQAGAVLGTPLYMSPEQALGRRVDARSDLWSVAALCYQALSGKPPFAGGSAQALIISISTEEHLPLSVASPDLPLRIVKVIERGLHKQPEQRWQSAAEMADALRQALDLDRPRDALSAMEAAVPNVARSRVAAKGEQKIEPGRAGVWIAVVGVIGVVAIAGLLGAGLMGRDDRKQAVVEKEDVAEQEPEPVHEAEPVKEEPIGAATAATATTASTTASTTATTTTTTTTREAPAKEPEPVKQGEGTGKPLATDEIARVLREHDPALQRCYEDAVVATLLQGGVAAPEPVAMRADVELSVNAAGDVGEASVKGEIPEAMRACLLTALRGFRFPAAGAPTSLRLPMVFQPNVVRR